MTAKVVTWLGNDVGDAAGPSFCVWGDPLTRVHIKFEKDKPLTIADDEAADPGLRELNRHILAVAPSNRFFTVEDAPPPVEPEAGEERARHGAHHGGRKK
jgi:hypothetical protein